MYAQQQPARPLPVKVPKGWKPGDADPGVKKNDDKLVGREKMLQGLSLSFDVYNFATRFLGSYGGPEAALRVNLWDTWFPVFEAGVGMTDHTDDQTNINYKANAPYFRIGVDKNMLRNKKDFARLYAGFRYGFTSFKYSVDAPPQTDEIWGGQYYLNQSGVTSTWGWLELGVGIQVRIIRFFHLGLGARYKVKLHHTNNEFSEPWYVPGYGTAGSHWALNYSLIFDLSKGSFEKPKPTGGIIPPDRQIQRGPSKGKASGKPQTEAEKAAQKAQEAHKKAEAAHKAASEASESVKKQQKEQEAKANETPASTDTGEPVEITVPKAAGKRNTSE